MDDYSSYYLKGKGKGKQKSKKGMHLDAYAAWTKGKGKSKTAGNLQRSVNAYASQQDVLYHGLEMASTMTTTTPTPSRPELGMVDCGATASAAPEAVVKGLISSIFGAGQGSTH